MFASNMVAIKQKANPIQLTLHTRVASTRSYDHSFASIPFPAITFVAATSIHHLLSMFSILRPLAPETVPCVSTTTR